MVNIFHKKKKSWDYIANGFQTMITHPIIHLPYIWPTYSHKTVFTAFYHQVLPSDVLSVIPWLRNIEFELFRSLGQKSQVVKGETIQTYLYRGQEVYPHTTGTDKSWRWTGKDNIWARLWQWLHVFVSPRWPPTNSHGLSPRSSFAGQSHSLSSGNRSVVRKNKYDTKSLIVIIINIITQTIHKNVNSILAY